LVGLQNSGTWKEKAALERHSYIDIARVWGVGFECGEFHGKLTTESCVKIGTHSNNKGKIYFAKMCQNLLFYSFRQKHNDEFSLAVDSQWKTLK